jgi:hypothetical protein
MHENAMFIRGGGSNTGINHAYWTHCSTIGAQSAYQSRKNTIETPVFMYGRFVKGMVLVQCI